jgi:hypothetical protein
MNALGTGGKTSYILNICTRCRLVVSFILQLVYPQGMKLYLWDRKLGGPMLSI